MAIVPTFERALAKLGVRRANHATTWLASLSQRKRPFEALAHRLCKLP